MRIVATLALASVLTLPPLADGAPGDLDPTFGVGGVVVGPLEHARDEAIQPDGRVVVVGASTLDGWYAITVVRLQVDGSLDPTFGSGGVVTTSLDDGHDLSTAVALQPDGRILVAGETNRSLNSFNSGDMVVLRYLANGTLDPSFGDGGVVRTSFGPNSDAAYDMVVQPNDKIVIAGHTVVGTAPRFALARYDANGAPDVAFGTGGKVVTAFGNLSDSPTSMALQPDGKLLVAGSSRFTSPLREATVARYNPDGTLDAGFGTGGVFFTARAQISGFNAMTLQSDGKIVAAGYTDNFSADDLLVVRLDGTGAPDPTFGTAGTVVTNIDGAFLAGAVLVQPDGRTVAGGFRYDSWPPEDEDYDFQLVRFDASGAPDAGFGVGGSVMSNLGEGESVHALRRQLDGKIVAVGWGHVNDAPKALVARYEGTPTACGNGVTEPPEGCDDGNVAAGDGCDASCAVESGYACAGMPSVCTPGCGDGTIGGSEDCDDGGLVAGDGCNATCGLEPGWTCTGTPSSCASICGDSRIVGGEECDDGNDNGGDCCDAGCQAEAAGSSCLDEGDGCTVDTCAGGGVCQHAFDLDLCPVCDDGILTGDEDCEDGNTADGDCCNASCHSDPVGTDCTPDGDLCSNDSCTAGGVCEHVVAPDPTCLLPIAPAKAQLKIVDASNDQVQFTWAKGPAIAKADFGMPSTGTPQYALCLYDHVAGVPVSVARAIASGDGDCSDQACWIESKTGWRLKNTSGAADGIVALKLIAGQVAGKSKVQVKMKGAALTVPSLPLASESSVVAQVRSSAGQCYGAVFSVATKNDGTTYRAKSD